jgi:hypothetical protein
MRAVMVQNCTGSDESHLPAVVLYPASKTPANKTEVAK